MDPLTASQEILDTMLGYLGFTADVTCDPEAHLLQVSTHDGKLLIGDHGSRIDDIAHLVNRLVETRFRDAPRIRVDVDNYFASRDYQMIEEADQVAAQVLATGRTMKLEPMNSYQRRMIHNHFKDHPSVRTWSPEDNARLKRISLSVKSVTRNSSSE